MAAACAMLNDFGLGDNVSTGATRIPRAIHRGIYRAWRTAPHLLAFMMFPFYDNTREVPPGVRGRVVFLKRPRRFRCHWD